MKIKKFISNMNYIEKSYKKRIIIRNIKKDMKMNEEELEIYIGENDLFDDENYFKLFKTKYKKELNTITDNRIVVNKILHDLENLKKDSLNNFGVFPNEVEKYNTYLNTLLRKEKIKMILNG